MGWLILGLCPIVIFVQPLFSGKPCLALGIEHLISIPDVWGLLITSFKCCWSKWTRYQSKSNLNISHVSWVQHCHVMSTYAPCVMVSDGDSVRFNQWELSIGDDWPITSFCSIPRPGHDPSVFKACYPCDQHFYLESSYIQIP